MPNGITTRSLQKLEAYLPNLKQTRHLYCKLNFDLDT